MLNPWVFACLFVGVVAFARFCNRGCDCPADQAEDGAEEDWDWLGEVRRVGDRF